MRYETACKRVSIADYQLNMFNTTPYYIYLRANVLVRRRREGAGPSGTRRIVPELVGGLSSECVCVGMSEFHTDIT